jgi:hypothetical protein
VLNVQGGPAPGATVTVSTNNEPPLAKVVTAEDGSFALPNLEPGVYTVTVSIANGQQVREEVTVDSEAAPARADFRFTAAAEGVAGLEERNPNIFIYRIDLNDLRNLLTLFRGANPTLHSSTSRADENYFGAEYGAPLLSFQPPRPRAPLRDWHASVSATHQNSALNTRNFFNVGPLLASRITSYDLSAGGPLVSSKASLLVDFRFSIPA